MADTDGDFPGPWDSLEGTPDGQCLNRLCEALIDMNLPSIEDNWWIRDPPNPANGLNTIIVPPAGILSPYVSSHDPGAGTVGGADWNVRTMVCIYTSAAGNVELGGRVQSASLPDRLNWQHQLRLAFQKRADTYGANWVTIDGVQMVATNIEPGDVRVIEAWRLANLDALWLTVTHWLRYPPGGG